MRTVKFVLVSVAALGFASASFAVEPAPVTPSAKAIEKSADKTAAVIAPKAETITAPAVATEKKTEIQPGGTEKTVSKAPVTKSKTSTKTSHHNKKSVS